jgi:radical SAM superfamily enzyme YgiQ (UPF0313 family)
MPLKVLLVNPPTERQLFGTGGLFLPIGLAYIAAVLMEDGHKVEAMDLTVHPRSPEEFKAIVGEKKPDIVGFSAVTPTVNMAVSYAAKAKEAGCPLTVAGGPHVTALPDEALGGGVDVVVRGEGELTMRELAADPGNYAGIKGVSYIRDGKVAHNPDREFIQDLDGLPFPARSLFPDMRLYKGQPVLGNRTPIGNISTSRGCPYGCRFCFKALFGRKFRTRSAESIVAEWERLVKDFGVKEITISDDAFTTDAERVHRVCDLLIEKKLNIPWTCSNGIRVNTATYELLSHMKKAGCYRVAFGIENGDQEILNKIGKKITLRQVEDAVKTARRVGIKTTGFFMLGGPWDTVESMKKTIAFAVKVQPDYAQFSIATPYPGSELYDIARKDGNLLISDWGRYDIYETAVYFEMPGRFTQEDVLELNRQAYRSFYLHPRTVVRKLLTLDTYRYMSRSIGGFRKFLLPQSPFGSD